MRSMRWLVSKWLWLIGGVLAAGLGACQVAAQGAAGGQQNGGRAAGEALTGRVRRPDGKPAGSAAVYWISRGERGAVLRATVETDEQGRFRFENAPRLRQQGSLPQILVQAAAGGLTFRHIPPAGEAMMVTLDPPTAGSVAPGQALLLMRWHGPPRPRSRRPAGAFTGMPLPEPSSWGGWYANQLTHLLPEA